MSGLAALLRFRGNRVSRSDVAPLATALTPWAADGAASWVADDAAGLAIASTRFLPEDACGDLIQQSLDGRHVLAAVCRLDNRPELAADLGMTPARARAASDTAYVQAAFARWRRGCVEHLLGAFRIAVWDRRERTLWAAVDHLGEYGLFYFHSQQQLVIASTIPIVLAAHGVPRRLDLTAWTRHLIDAREYGQTCLDGVTALHGGQTLTASSEGQLTVRTYWQLSPPPRRPNRATAEIDEQFREVFDTAVAARLRSAGPVGAFCSGGLDSTSVSAVAASALSRTEQRLTTFTSVPSPEWTHPPGAGWENSDEPYVRSLARWHRNLDPVLVPPDGRIFLDHLARVHATTGSPFRNSLNLTWLQAIDEAASARGINVLLTGNAGNGTVSWAGRELFGVLLRRGRLWSAWQEHRAQVPASAGAQPGFPRRAASEVAPHRWLLRRDRRRLAGSPAWQPRAALHPAYAANAVNQKELLQRYRTPRSSWAAHEMLLAPYRMSSGLRDASIAQHGVVHRDPTADLRVVEFCFALPTSAFAADGKRRLLIRRGMHDALPPDIRWRTTRGAQAPDAFLQLAGRRKDLAAAVAELRHNATTRELLDMGRLSRFVDGGLDTYRTGTFAEICAVTRTIAAGLYVLWVEHGD